MIATTASFRDEEAPIPVPNNSPKINIDDSYCCINCHCPVEIYKIDDKKNTVTFKCLNPKEKETIKTIPISEYLNSMKKYTYLYSECSLCHKKQNELKDTPIFSYCIKCDEIICSDCIKKHLEINEKNHPDLNTKYIIKNNEKNIKCLLHPEEKNVAFCLECNTHICNKCMISKNHINHTKNNIIEVSVTDKMKNILNDIINFYKKRIMQLNDQKEKKEMELLKIKEDNKEKKEKQKKNKLQELLEELKKELILNEKKLNDNLYKLKLKYENDVKLCKNKFNLSKVNIEKKYQRLNISYNKKLKEEIYNIEKEYKSCYNIWL